MTERDEYPAPPPVCAVCAGIDGLESITLTKVFIPNWVWVLLPFGVLPAALISLAVQTRHALSFRYCSRCRNRRRWATAIHWLAMLSCIVLLFLAVFVGLSMRSWLAFGGMIGVTVGVAAASSRFESSVNPHFSIFSAKEVEIDIPGYGRFLVVPPYYLLPKPPA